MTARCTAAKGAAAALALGFALPAPASAEMQDFTLDPNHTDVIFMVSHIGYAKVIGRFSNVQGTFDYDVENKELANLEVTIPTETVTIGPGAGTPDDYSQPAQDRDEHVRSGDFLNASQYPEITFEMTGAKQTGENTGVITGDLTLLGETHEVKLDVTLNKAARYPFGGGEFSKPPFVVGVSARTTIDRSRWGMTYGVDNGIVGKQVQVIIEAEARRDREKN